MARGRAKEECAPFYDTDGLREQAADVHRAQKRTTAKEKFHQNPEPKREAAREASRKSYQDNPEPKREAARESYNLTPQKKRAAVKKNYEATPPKQRKENRQAKYEKEKAARDLRLLNKTSQDRYIDFRKDLKDTWSVGCISCHQIQNSGKWFKDGLSELQRDLDKIDTELFKKSIDPSPRWRGLTFDEGVFLCSTCQRWLFKKKERPPMSSLNELGVADTPDECKDLNDLEKALTSKNILFVRVRIMPRSRWRKQQGKTVSIPIPTDRLLSTINNVNTQLPRDPRKPEESGLICVRLKRKLEYKTTHVEAYVCPDKMNKVVMKYKELGHPGYADIPNIPVSNRFSAFEDEEVSSQSENDSDSEEEQEDHAQDDRQDAIRRNQFDLGGHTTMQHMHPETSVMQGSPNNKQQRDATVDVAPGEGVIPSNIMRDEDWDINSFPDLFPDGKFGLHADRDKPVSAQQYLLQRLRHISGNFAKDPLFLFAAHYYIERLTLKGTSILVTKGAK